MQKNLSFIQENYYFYPNIHEDLAVNDIEKQLQKEKESSGPQNIFLSNNVRAITAMTSSMHDLCHNII